MADDPVVDNGGEANYKVRADDVGDGKLVQHVRLDLGADAASAIPAAHDAPVTGTPVPVGASSETPADSAPANRVSADGDASRLSVVDGALFVIPTGPQIWSYHVDGSGALTDAVVHAAPGAGLSLYVTEIVVSLGAAVAMNLFFEEGANKVLGPYYLEGVSGRGLALHFGTPKKITPNTALTLTTSGAVAHTVDVLGFVAPG